MLEIRTPITHRKSIASTSSTGTRQEKRAGKIVGILSAKGGCGATTLAINVSAALADQAGDTVLVDANLQNPDVGLMLGKQMEFGLLELITGASEPTQETLDACTVPIMQRRYQWSLLAPPPTGDAALKTQLTDVSRCVSAARTVADFWLVDLPNHLDRHLVTMLDSCDVVLVVFEETMASVSAARRWWNAFAQLGYESNKIIYVMNRAGSRTSAGVARAKELLPEECVTVPNCFTLLDDSALTAAPPVVANPRHKFSEAIRNLAQQIKDRTDGGNNG